MSVGIMRPTFANLSVAPARGAPASVDLRREPDTGACGPLVSVVIPSVNGLPAIGECLEVLVAQATGRPCEILVVDCTDTATRSALRSRFPQVRVIEVDRRRSIPALRSLGVAEAHGRLVAFIEDHCLVQPGWLDAVIGAAIAGRCAVGGAIENACVNRLVDWAVFFCEYARYMPPVAAGAVRDIPGANSAYDRRLLKKIDEESRAELWEAFLLDRMRELGVECHSLPAMTVAHKKSFRFAYYVSQRFHYSRSFAAMRLRKAGPLRRLLYACATAALPPVLLSRIVKVVVRKGGRMGKLLPALPMVGVFVTAWSVGEAVGALFGPGRSLERVE